MPGIYANLTYFSSKFECSVDFVYDFLMINLPRITVDGCNVTNSIFKSENLFASSFSLRAKKIVAVEASMSDMLTLASPPEDNNVFLPSLN